MKLSLIRKREGVKVLIVDDKEQDLYLLETILKKWDYEVITATNGEEALKKLHSEGADFVISDILMPVMDGFKAINQIRTHPRTSHIPIFVVSAWSSKKERTQAKLEGADEFFVKPPDLDKLIESIEQAVAASKK